MRVRFLSPASFSIFFRRSHGDDAITGDGDGFGEGLALIHRVNRRVDDY